MGVTAPAASWLRQRTLKSSINCRGVGLHSGACVNITLRPATADSGIVFRRVDLPGKPLIPARWDAVSDTRLNTCIANEDGVSVRTIEHLMAALAGSGIDNAVVDIDGPEVPVMDGSASPFLFLIACAGTIELSVPRRSIRVLKRVEVRDGEKVAALTPAFNGFSLRFEIDFADPAISRQEVQVHLREGAFKRDIGRARTFGFEHEVEALRAAGLARGGSLDNAVVIGRGSRILNEDGLRYDDEFVRHKVLDAVGDLYLAGAPIIGHFHGVRSGHALNNRLLHALFADESAWTWTPAGVEAAMPMPMASGLERLAG
jgi:UDP-3-O-[3-hydroxymyristoyl] N-acetylglucosamine deacetylase